MVVGRPFRGLAVALACVCSVPTINASAQTVDVFINGIQTYPKPATAFDVWVSETLVDYETRIDRTIRLQLSSNLYNALTGVDVAPGLGSVLTAQYSLLASNQVDIAIDDNGSTGYYAPPGGRPLFKLSFGPLAASTETLSVIAVANTDLGGNPVPSTFETSPTTIDIADLKVYPQVLPTAFIEHLYYLQFNAPHATAAVTWSLVGGALPNGLTLDAGGSIRGSPAPGSAGNYAITVRADEVGGAWSQFPLALQVINKKPKLSYAFFIDTNNSGTVTQLDQIKLVFDEKLILGLNWLASIPLGRPGDTYGAGATISLSAPDTALVTLGTSPVLGGLGMSSRIITASATNGITDLQSNPVSATTVMITEPFINPNDMSNLVTGVAIQPIVLNRPPFAPRTVFALNLPPGLGVVTTPTLGTRIIGTPTSVGGGTIVIREQSATLPTTLTDRIDIGFDVRSSPLPSFGLADFDASLVYRPGELLVLTLLTADGVTPATASIGGVSLLSVPGRSVKEPMFILPDNTATGVLMIQQGASVYNAGTVTVTPHTESGADPFVDQLFRWRPTDDTTYPYGLIALEGYNYLPTPSIVVGTTAATVISSGDFYIVAALPASIASGTTVNITIANGDPAAQPVVIQVEGTVQNTTNPEDGNVKPDDPIKERIKQWCKILQKALERMGSGGKPKPPDTKTNDEKWVALFKCIGLHESEGLTDRWQDTGKGPTFNENGGVGYGICQMEPKTWADMMTQTKNQGEMREHLKKDLKWSDAAIDCLFTEAKTIIESGKNEWPATSKACPLLLSSDLFAAVCARCELRRHQPAIVDVGTFPGSIEKEVAYAEWIRWWKKLVKPKPPQTQEEAEAALKKLFIDTLCGYLEEINS